MSNKEEIKDIDELRVKAIELEKKINAVDCTNIMSVLKSGMRISFSASQDGCSMETFEGVFVHYSRPTNLITVLMDNGTITTYNLSMLFCVSYSVEELEKFGGR